MTYRRYGDYVGVGPGAHGRLTIGGEKRAFRQHRAPEAWLNAVERHGHATRTDLAITPEERFAEMAMMGLRLSEGLRRSRVIEETGAALEDWIGTTVLDRLVEGGFSMADEERLAATAAGRQRLDSVLAALLA